MLQEDGGPSHADLATRVGASTASCWRRIKALEAAGVLRGTVRLVDPEQVGCCVTVMCDVRLRSHAREDRSSFETFVDGRGEILECYSVSGEWDYLLRIVGRDIAGYGCYCVVAFRALADQIYDRAPYLVASRLHPSERPRLR